MLTLGPDAVLMRECLGVLKASLNSLPFITSIKGSLAVIGRWAAVANAFGVHLSGLVAWIVWAFIHLTYIVTFQNRLFGFHPVGDPGLDVQSWSAADHRYCAYRLQLQ